MFEIDPNEAIKFSIMAGEIMLASGAETSRVEDTMLRLLEKCGLDEPESFATTTGVFVTALKDSKPITMLKRVKNRANNFEKVALANEISRKFVSGEITIIEGIKALKDIKARSEYPIIVRMSGAAAASFCFAAMFGGNIWDSTAALLAAFLMQLPCLLLEKWGIVAALRNITGGAFAALFALTFINLGLGNTLDFIIIGGIMPLVPGVSLTNAIRDILEGDLLSGSARILDAFLIAVSIAAGVGVVLQMWFNFFGGFII